MSQKQQRVSVIPEKLLERVKSCIEYADTLEEGHCGLFDHPTVTFSERNETENEWTAVVDIPIINEVIVLQWSDSEDDVQVVTLCGTSRLATIISERLILARQAHLKEVEESKKRP